MKKILVLAAVLIFAATSSFAADTASGATGSIVFTNIGLTLHGDATTASTTTAAIGKASTGVGVGWITQVNGYALVTQHQSGTKGYGSSYDSTSIFQFTGVKEPGEIALAVPTATDTTSFVTGWKAM